MQDLVSTYNDRSCGWVGQSVSQLVRMSIFLTLLIGREPVSGSGSGEVCTVCTDW